MKTSILTKEFRTESRRDRNILMSSMNIYVYISMYWYLLCSLSLNLSLSSYDIFSSISIDTEERIKRKEEIKDTSQLPLSEEKNKSNPIVFRILQWHLQNYNC